MQNNNFKPHTLRCVHCPICDAKTQQREVLFTMAPSNYEREVLGIHEWRCFRDWWCTRCEITQFERVRIEWGEPGVVWFAIKDHIALVGDRPDITGGGPDLPFGSK